MDTVQEAKAVLADAEKSLRDLMQRELRAQRYRDLAEVASLADALSGLARGGASPAGAAAAPTGNLPTRAESQKAAAKPKRKGKGKKADPRFERDGEKLVKVGWSKKAREEYEHRAPRSAALAFAIHLGKSVQAGKAFLVDDISPVHDSAGEEIPSYQVYLTLAWLRSSGAVEKKGRDGYYVPKPHTIADGFDDIWESLPVRNQ